MSPEASAATSRERLPTRSNDCNDFRPKPPPLDPSPAGGADSLRQGPSYTCAVTLPARELRDGAGYMNHQFGIRRWLVAEDHVPGGPPVGAAAPVVVPQWPGVALFAVIFAALCAYYWASTWPAKPLAAVLVDQAW